MTSLAPWLHLSENKQNDGNTGSLLQLAGGDAAQRRRHIFEKVLYNVTLMLIYHGILVGIVLVFTIRHWKIKFLRRRGTRQRLVFDFADDCSVQRYGGDDGGDSAESSSSSTLSGNAPLPPQALKADDNERQPLLELWNVTRRPLSFTKRCMRKCNSVAIYQPPNLPLANKVLPSNASTAVISLFIGLNIFFAFYDISFDTEMLIVLSDRTAILFAANLPWLYILAAKNQPLKILTGYSYEGLNIIHRRLGEILCILPILHGTAMLLVWWFEMHHADPIHFFTHPRIVLGIVAFFCYEVLYLTSLASFRNWWYEVFLASHVVLQTAGLAIVYLHHPGGRIYAKIAIAIFLVDRLVFRLGLKSKTFKANLTVMEDGETVLLARNWPLRSRWARVFGWNIEYGWNPMEHIFITVPALGKVHVLQAHPFTIASAAPESVDQQQHAWLNLVMRAHKGFTRDLLNYARTHSSATIRVDGPYGSLHAVEMLGASDITLIVAGGSGIAVAYPLLWKLLHSHKLSENDAESQSPARSTRQVGLIWIIHDSSHITWLGQDRLDDLREKGLHLCIPGPTSKAGRPDLPALTRRMIGDMTRTADFVDPKVGVVVSGPDGANKGVRNTCSALAWEGWDIEVAVEKYGW